MICEDVLKSILFLLKVQDSFLSFVSGIFVAASVNIYTSQLPESVLGLGIPYMLVGINLLLIAFLLMRWSIIIRPALLDFEQGINIRKKDNIPDDQGWYDSLQKENIKTKVLLIIVHIIILAIITIVLVLRGSSAVIIPECMCPECT